MVIRVRRLLSHPSLPQGTPTDQSAPEREERLVDVGPLVITDAQASELVEPRKRPFHDPPPPAQPTPVRGTTHGDPRYDMPRPQPTTNRRSVVAAIPEHRVRPLPGPPVCRAAEESHPPTPGLLGSRS